MEQKKIEEIEECPHCGSDFGYYQRVYVSGWINDKKLFEKDPDTGQRFIYNYELFDHLKWSRFSKYYYCMECNKKICKV